MRLLRTLARRKLRTTLTILGITIGIWALVVFSSMANKINALVEGGSQYYADKVIVTDASDLAVGAGFSPMEIAAAHEIDALDGVALAVPQVQMLFDPGTGAASFGVPDFIIGALAGADDGYEEFETSYAQGRAMTPEDEGSRVTVLGADLARKHAMQAGDTIELRGRSFEVVGVLEPTLTAPDTGAFIPLKAAQELLAADLPPFLRGQLDAGELATQVVVYPESGAVVSDLAERVESAISGVQAMTGADFDEQVGSATAIFNAIIIGVAIISLVVGGLSVINTMAMSVAERTREIGIKRAIGGARGRIVRELVAEAATIGLLGGLIGLALGGLVVVLANEAARAGGTVLFDLTPGTAIFAVTFSTILGMLAGIVPAWSAARLDPVTALRYE